MRGNNKEMLRRIILLVVLPLQAVFANPFSRLGPQHAMMVFQAGGFYASQGNAEDIGIVGLIGDHYTVAHPYAKNGLLGLGYFIDGMETNRVKWMYGLNAFYLAHTLVQGDIIQEELFDNLSYSYTLTNYPIYLAAKTLLNTGNDNYLITFDFGVGPNIIKTSSFKENSLDGVTLPDNAFSGQTSVAFSVTAGVGVKLNNVFGQLPLELGYRFFYLGQGNLNKVNSEVINTLNTGKNYANALVFSVST